MTKKFIDLRQVVAASEGLTLTEIYARLDNAFRVVLGADVFDNLYGAYLSDDDDDEVGDAETPNF